MNSPRRRFLGCSLVLLGGTLLDALATPLWKWKRSVVLASDRGTGVLCPYADARQKHDISASRSGAEVSPVTFVDVAKEAGLTTPNVWGGVDHKRYIIEAKGS